MQILGQQRQNAVMEFLQQEGTIIHFSWKRKGESEWIVINPVWLIEVMRCIITVKNTLIVDGILQAKDIPSIFYTLSSSKYSIQGKYPIFD